jgi:hypothetical protein
LVFMPALTQLGASSDDKAAMNGDIYWRTLVKLLWNKTTLRSPLSHLCTSSTVDSQLRPYGDKR